MIILHNLPDDVKAQINVIKNEKVLFYSIGNLIFDCDVVVEIDFSTLTCVEDDKNQGSYRCVYNCKIVKWCDGVENVSSFLHIPLKTFVRSLKPHNIDIEKESRKLLLRMRKCYRIGKGTRYKLKILDCEEVKENDN